MENWLSARREQYGLCSPTSDLFSEHHCGSAALDGAVAADELALPDSRAWR